MPTFFELVKLVFGQMEESECAPTPVKKRKFKSGPNSMDNTLRAMKALIDMPKPQAWSPEFDKQYIWFRLLIIEFDCDVEFFWNWINKYLEKEENQVRKDHIFSHIIVAMHTHIPEILGSEAKTEFEKIRASFLRLSTKQLRAALRLGNDPDRASDPEDIKRCKIAIIVEARCRGWNDADIKEARETPQPDELRKSA